MFSVFTSADEALKYHQVPFRYFNTTSTVLIKKSAGKLEKGKLRQPKPKKITSSGGARQRRRKSTTDEGQPEIVGSAAKKWSHSASSGSNFFLQKGFRSKCGVGQGGTGGTAEEEIHSCQQKSLV